MVFQPHAGAKSAKVHNDLAQTYRKIGVSADEFADLQLKP
ncbi:hypothetical protein BN2497_5787 [Janthinobacterium sp. CG23_2]|nr:hypothetical protein BN2497_5787 [Janthinobacterium sp. CG23_2]CUU29291.1 hypothetical protein BN3177_5787 [Janthinobacterium sp. CG23_2]